MTGGITVCADPSAAGGCAVRWAASEAARRDVELQVVVPDDKGRQAAQDASGFARVLDMVGGAARQLPLGLHALGSSPATLRVLSADATALVVPATLPDLPAVVEEAFCPVVVVPDTSDTSTDRPGPVVLGMAPWTEDDVIEAAVRAAADRGVPLLAVRALPDPALDLGWIRSSRDTSDDGVEQRAHHDLDVALSAWAMGNPEVSVETAVVVAGPVQLLGSLSHRAALLVIGRSARGSLLAGLAPAPVDALLRHSRCPVMVVPAEGPPRPRWLPDRSHRRMFMAR